MEMKGLRRSKLFALSFLECGTTAATKALADDDRRDARAQTFGEKPVAPCGGRPRQPGKLTRGFRSLGVET